MQCFNYICLHFFSVPKEGSVLSSLSGLGSHWHQISPCGHQAMDTKLKLQRVCFYQFVLSLWLCLHNIPTKFVNSGNILIWIEGENDRSNLWISEINFTKRYEVGIFFLKDRLFNITKKTVLSNYEMLGIVLGNGNPFKSMTSCSYQKVYMLASIFQCHILTRSFFLHEFEK